LLLVKPLRFTKKLKTLSISILALFDGQDEYGFFRTFYLEKYAVLADPVSPCFRGILSQLFDVRAVEGNFPQLRIDMGREFSPDK
jgi:hypothetical protein